MPLEILDEIGQTYGPTRKLHQALANLVAATISNLERSRKGPNHQELSFSSPAHALDSRPMQLPIRIDPALHVETAARQSPIPPTTVPSSGVHTIMQPQGSGNRPESLLSWQDTLSGQISVHQENQFPHGVASRQTPTAEPGHFSPQEGFDESMLWGPSLEWTGGWDDFLNAIAM
jgi:hypothetical protein